jgi:tetratricopeptide (TPR) repeat protein
LIRWRLLLERSRAGERRRARFAAGSGVALLFLGLLWAAGFGRIVGAVVAWALVAVALLELAAVVQASNLRRLAVRGRPAVRTIAAVPRASLPLVSEWFATVFALVKRAAVTARPIASRGTASAAGVLRRARRRRETIAAERKAHNLNALGAQLRRSGAVEAAADQHRAALAIVRALGDRRAEALTLNNVALALAPTDDAAAVRHFEQAATILRQLGDSQHEGQVIANLGMTHRRQGRSEEADRLLETALGKLDPDTPEHRQVREQLRRAS